MSILRAREVRQLKRLGGVEYRRSNATKVLTGACKWWAGREPQTIGHIFHVVPTNLLLELRRQSQEVRKLSFVVCTL